MRAAAFLAAVAPVIASAIPGIEEPSSAPSFDRRDDFTSGVLDGKILSSDLYAGVAALNQQIYQATQKPEQWKKCNPLNIVVRREWASFSTPQKENYIEAIRCLTKLPPKTPKSLCPGCKNRYDDFVAVHIQQTFSIHNTGNFLAWHRWYTWAYEQTLRNECGYKGQQPYYNWARWADDPSKSPVLDGSLLSMGGNGIKEGGCPNQTFYGIPTNDAPVIKIPRSGQNGGCVTSGPFKDWSVNIGPGLTGLSCDPPNPNNNFTDPSFGLDYNPRCLKRDVSSWASSRYSNDEMVTKLLKSEDIKTFWSDLQGTSTTGGGPFETGMGVHTAGHFTVAGTASDFLASPIDPYFYFHHSAIDRAWFTWQNMNPANRTDAIYGTIVISDPTAPDTKLTDTMTLGHAYPGSLTVGEAMSTMNGLFCYTYV